MPSLLLTGPTRGLGLATARALAADPGTDLLLGGRSAVAVGELATQLGATPVVFDLADLASVERAVAGLGPVDVVVCNAGLQFVDAGETTVDGFEATFQVNHLAHLLLIDRLLARPQPPARIVLVGSGTHDPAIRTGMPAPMEGTVGEMSRAQVAGGGDGRQRYATSKLLNTATMLGLARERPDVEVLCLDPGLMPGTGLARDAGAVARVLWGSVLLGLRVLPFASSAKGSGAVLARLALGRTSHPSGTLVDHRDRALTASVRARDEAFQDEVLRESRALLAGGVTTAGR